MVERTLSIVEKPSFENPGWKHMKKTDGDWGYLIDEMYEALDHDRIVDMTELPESSDKILVMKVTIER